MWGIAWDISHVALMFVTALLDLIGVGLVLPVLMLLTSHKGGGGGGGGGVLAAWVEPLRALGETQAIVVAMLALVGFTLVKSGCRWFLTNRQSAFAFCVQRSLSKRLFEHLLRREWAFHLQRNSATLVQSVVHEVDQFAFGVVLPSLMVASEGLVLFGVATLILVIEPLGGAVALGVLGGSGFVLHRLTQSRATALGLRRRDLDRMRFRQIQHGFGAVKEAKILGREAHFVARFDAASEEAARVGRRVQTLRELPRMTIETVAIAGVAALVLAMALAGRSIESIVPVLGLFIVAALRIVPSIARFLSALQSIGLGRANVLTLREELEVPCEGLDTALPPEALVARDITLESVSFAYRGGARSILESVDLTIRAGETVGIVGASGSGKSTLIDLLLGLHAPHAGRIMVAGVDVASRLRWWQSQIGYVPQHIFLVDGSVRRNVALGIPDGEINSARLDAAINAAQLRTFVESLPQGLDTSVGERGLRISGGQRQRIGIARALYHDPAMLVLDEATSALDAKTELEVMVAIDALHGSRTIIIVAHRLETLAGCDRFLRVENGGVVAVSREILGM